MSTKEGIPVVPSSAAMDQLTAPMSGKDTADQEVTQQSNWLKSHKQSIDPTSIRFGAPPRGSIYD